MTKSASLALASAAVALVGALSAPMAHAAGEARAWYYDASYPSSGATDTIGTPKTREQVRAELAEAQRAGTLIFGEGGQRLNEISPNQYASTPTSARLSRIQVKAELAEAIRTGDVIVGEGGSKLNELYPQQYRSAKAKSATQVN